MQKNNDIYKYIKYALDKFNKIYQGIKNKKILRKKKYTMSYVSTDFDNKLVADEKSKQFTYRNLNTIGDIKEYKKSSTSTNRKFRTISRKGLYNSKPHSDLVKNIGNTGGRNNSGRKTVRLKTSQYTKVCRSINRHPISTIYDFDQFINNDINNVKNLISDSNVKNLNEKQIIDIMIKKSNKKIKINKKDARLLQKQIKLISIKNSGSSKENSFVNTLLNNGTVSTDSINEIIPKEDFVNFEILRLERTPQCSNFIALIREIGNLKRILYIPMEKNMVVGKIIQIGYKTALNPGNITLLSNVTEGSIICCIESKPNKGIDIVRSAGTCATVLYKNTEQNYADVRLPSGEVRRVKLNCQVMIGQNANINHHLVQDGKAGKTFHKGRRPRTSASSMNCHDHAKAGNGRHACNKHGRAKSGQKTSTAHKRNNTAIIKTRRNKVK